MKWENKGVEIKKKRTLRSRYRKKGGDRSEPRNKTEWSRMPYAECAGG